MGKNNRGDLGETGTAEAEVKNTYCGYRGKMGNADVEVFYFITTNLVADFRPPLLDTAK